MLNSAKRFMPSLRRHKSLRTRSSSTFSSYKKGFTLIELLLVIVIIGVLAGTVISVINPDSQRRKAAEGVAVANLSKMCQALVACQASMRTPNNSKCDSYEEIGVTLPTSPANANWAISYGGSGITSWVSLGAFITHSGGTSCNLTCTAPANLSDWNGSNPGRVFVDAINNNGAPQGTTGCESS